jgi:MFS superfamily sulfate permease-like transporter
MPALCSGPFSLLSSRYHPLTQFFPLSIENIGAFFAAANASALTNPLAIIALTFHNFNAFTLLLTVACVAALFLLRNKVNQIPFIGVVVLLGIIANWRHSFLSYEDLCGYPEVDCRFYIIKLSNIAPPSLERIIMLTPSAAVMAVVVIFEQFLYLEEFERRGKRYFGEGTLGQTERESKVLGIGNLLSGFLGGLPICINLFGTYESFSFNVRQGSQGTRLVGLMQVPISYALYSFLRFVYQRTPMFVLFVIVATPSTYFLTNMLALHHRHLAFICCLAALNVLTHPIIALILAAFISIHDIAILLKDTPAEILLENVDADGSRRSLPVAKKSKMESKESDSDSGAKAIEFERRVIYIDTDQPTNPGFEAYVLYRFTGAVSYLNYFEHMKEISELVDKFIKTQKNIRLLLSFRYSQIIDEESLTELALYVEQLKDKEQITVIFTGLHKKLILEMAKIPFFEQMLRNDEHCMFRLDTPQD